MLRFHTVLMAGLLSVISVNALADTKIIINTVPPDREVVVAPRGYVNCHKVPAGYHNGVWTNQHKICEYSRNRGVWISGHWQCMNFKPVKGICVRWDWAPSHWESPRVAVYNPPMPRQPHAVVAYGSPIAQGQPMPVAVQPPAQPVMPPPVVVQPNAQMQVS